MGLDMYLRGRRYLGHKNSVADKVQQLFPELEGRVDDYGSPVIVEIEILAGYWRKANAVHQWFVDNVQAGRDECQSTYVDRTQLETLRELCMRVLADHSLAAELLPTQSGFFFGGTEYDAGYFQDLEHTVAVIDDALKLPSEWSFEYQSSW